MEYFIAVDSKNREASNLIWFWKDFLGDIWIWYFKGFGILADLSTVWWNSFYFFRLFFFAKKSAQISVSTRNTSDVTGISFLFSFSCKEQYKNHYKVSHRSNISTWFRTHHARSRTSTVSHSLAEKMTAWSMLNPICLNPPWSPSADFVSFYGRRASESSACWGMREGHGLFGLQERMKGFWGQVMCSHQNSTAATYDNLQSVKKETRERGIGVLG